MPAFYDVRTPLGRDRCDTEQEVTDRIAAYMQTDGALLSIASRLSTSPKPATRLLREKSCHPGTSGLRPTN